jgi:hypothetical protein
MNSEGLAKSGANLAVRLAKQRGELEAQTEEVKKLQVLSSSSQILFYHLPWLTETDIYLIRASELANPSALEAPSDDNGLNVPLSQEVTQSQLGTRFKNDLNMNPTQPFSCTVRLFVSNEPTFLTVKQLFMAASIDFGPN